MIISKSGGCHRIWLLFSAIPRLLFTYSKFGFVSSFLGVPQARPVFGRGKPRQDVEQAVIRVPKGRPWRMVISGPAHSVDVPASRSTPALTFLMLHRWPTRAGKGGFIFSIIVISCKTSLLYLNLRKFYKLERIGMILYFLSGPRACLVDKNARSVHRIAKLRTVTEASARDSLHVQGWRSAS
jgi:hypothetical protein